LAILLSDFVLHFVAFFILAFLLSMGYVKTKQIRLWWAKAAALSLLVGLLVEVIQIFLPYRNFSVKDMGVDVLGIVTALAFFALLTRGHSYFRRKWGD
jgi:VanZ family protein